jgi:dihydropyrimidinase
VLRENYDAIGWRIAALLKAGLTDPLQHAWARPPVVEREATHRAIALAELLNQPIQVFHVSCEAAAAEITRGRARGLKVWGETCPQYFTLSHDDLARRGFEGVKAVCSPALREKGENERVWKRIQDGTLDVVTSDHCGFSYATAKRMPGAAMARAMPRRGRMARLPSTPSPTVRRVSRRGSRCCSRKGCPRG